MIRTISFSIIALLIIATLSCSTESTPAYTLTTTASPAEGGEITPNAGTFDEGETVSLQATPNEGWVFFRWEQDLSTSANPMNVTMNNDYNVVGVFEKVKNNDDWPRDTFTEVVEVTNPTTGRTWMDRNLGASRAATSSTDEQAYGDLYQWGRAADGHQKRNSGTTSTLSNSDLPGHGEFILSQDWPYDWRSSRNNNLWQGINGTNNPCPSGYRLPTEAEWNTERQSWSDNNSAGAFSSLKLPQPGFRSRTHGGLIGVGQRGDYLSSTITGTATRHLLFDSSSALIYMIDRAWGASVRCTKN